MWTSVALVSILGSLLIEPIVCPSKSGAGQINGPESDIGSLVEQLKKQAGLLEGGIQNIPNETGGYVRKESDLSSIQETLSGSKERPGQRIDDDVLVVPKAMQISNKEGDKSVSQIGSVDHLMSGGKESKGPFTFESSFDGKMPKLKERIDNFGDSLDDSSDHLYASDGHQKDFSIGGNSELPLRIDTKWSETKNEPEGSLPLAPLDGFTKDKGSNLGEEKIDPVLRRELFGNTIPGQSMGGLGRPKSSDDGSSLQLLSNTDHSPKQKESIKVESFGQKESNQPFLNDSITNPDSLKSANLLGQQITSQFNVKGMPASMSKLQQMAGNSDLAASLTNNPELAGLASQGLKDPKLLASLADKGLSDPKLMASLAEKGLSDPKLMASLASQGLSMLSSTDNPNEEETPKSFWDLVLLKLTLDHWRKMNPRDYFFNIFDRFGRKRT